MKQMILVFLFLFMSIQQAFLQTSDHAAHLLDGYWKLVGTENPGGKRAVDLDFVLVMNGQTAQWFHQGKKVAWATYTTPVWHNTVLVFDFENIAPADNSYLYVIKSCTRFYNGYLSYGAACVDGADDIFIKMSAREIQKFRGVPLLKKTFRKKSKTYWEKYARQWKAQEPALDSATIAHKTGWEKDAYLLFDAFYQHQIRSAAQELNTLTRSDMLLKYHPWSIIDISRIHFSTQNFSYPPTPEAFTQFLQKRYGPDYEKNLNLTAPKDAATLEKLLKKSPDLLSSYMYITSKDLPKAPVPCPNFMPAINTRGQFVFLPLNADRKAEIIPLLQNPSNAHFLAQHINKNMGIVEYCEAYPALGQVIFSTNSPFAIVHSNVPYRSSEDLYEKKDGKWRFVREMSNITQ